LSLLPEFELGLWNAWIFMVPSLLLMLFSLRLFIEKRAPAASMRMSKTKLSFCLFSRHPFYVTEVLLLLGASIASASWVFLLFPIIVGVGAVYFIKIEEAQCIGHYGNAYREYMNRTPRWIGIPKSEKKD